MNLPFTLEQFLAVFVSYNTAVWPAQVLLNILALTAVILCFRPAPPSKAIAAILAAFWLWTGIVYHLSFFASVNPAAQIFGVLCVAQALVFLIAGVIRSQLSFRYPSSFHGFVGALMIIYGLLVYPVVGYFIGHVYPASPTFGAPCPTTIFTFGVLLWTDRKVGFGIIVIPFLWSIIGFMAALNFGIWEDTGLLIAGLVATLLLLWRPKAGEAVAAS